MAREVTEQTETAQDDSAWEKWWTKGGLSPDQKQRIKQEVARRVDAARRQGFEDARQALLKRQTVQTPEPSNGAESPAPRPTTAPPVRREPPAAMAFHTSPGTRPDWFEMAYPDEADPDPIASLIRDNNARAVRGESTYARRAPKQTSPSEPMPRPEPTAIKLEE